MNYDNQNYNLEVQNYDLKCQLKIMTNYEIPNLH